MGLVTRLAALELPASTRLALLPQGNVPPGTETIICESDHAGSVRCNATVVLSRHGLFVFRFGRWLYEASKQQFLSRVTDSP
jgi:hypothetical protein